MDQGNPLYRKHGEARRDDEVSRILLLIEQAEAKLDLQYKLLVDLHAKGVSSTRAVNTMHLFEEVIADLYSHLAAVQKLKV